MIYPFNKQLIILLVKFGVVLVVLADCSEFTVFARNDSDARQEIIQTENEAAKLKNIWSEPTIRQSLELYLKAAKQWETINHFPNAAGCLRDAVKLKIMLAEERSAIELLHKSLILEKKTRNFAGEAETFSLLTIVYTKLGEKELSQFYHQRSLKKAEKAKQPDAAAKVFFSSAFFFLNEQNFPEMKKQLEKSLTFYRSIGDKDGEAETLTELAYSSIINNNRVQGRDFAQAALEIAKSRNNNRNQAFALIALGDSYQRMGEWEQGIKFFNEAERLFPENLDYYEKAILINRIGFYNLAFGDLNLAKKYFQKSLSLFNKINKSEGSSELLSILGQISIEQKNYSEAMNYFNQSRAIAEKSNDSISLATLDLKIGESSYYLGKFEKAEKHFLRSLNYYNKIGLDFRIAEVQEKLGLVFEKQANFEEAREKYLLALNMNKKVLSKFAQAQNYYNLARLDNLQNQRTSALENIKESIKLTESSQGETANNQLKRRFFSQVYDRYELFINLLMKIDRQSPNENYSIQALQAVEKSRARSMLEDLSLSEANFIKDADAETVKREKEVRILLNTKADKLTDLLSQNGDKAETEKTSNEINELEHELEEIKARLKQQSPIYSAIKNPAPFDVAEFQNAVLDENTLLLEIAFGKEESYLWLVSKTEVDSYVLPSREQIETKIQKLRQLLSARQMIKGEEIEAYQERIIKTENDYWLAAKQLSDELFGQVADKFEKKRLIIVPDGKLNYFPVSALPLPNSDTGDPILLSHEVIYEPSALTLSIISKSQNQTSGAAKNLLVFSDPIFTKEDSRILATQTAENPNPETVSPESFRFVESLNSLSRLPDSKTEADSITEVFGQSYTDNYSGFAASREQLLNAKTADYRILHFATHGLIDEERPELSGIVLSRFAENGQKLDEFVRLHDIYGMNLNSDLVVLSACETGIGKEVRGEGLMSLNNAFLQVGAKSVMSSLWKVEDKATLELMKNFYQSLANENTTPSKALQKAQIKMWESGRYKSPFYWAAFTVQGDFRRAPDFSRDFPYAMVFSAIGLGGLLFGMFWFYGRKRGNRGLLNRK